MNVKLFQKPHKLWYLNVQRLLGISARSSDISRVNVSLQLLVLRPRRRRRFCSRGVGAARASPLLSGFALLSCLACVGHGLTTTNLVPQVQQDHPGHGNTLNCREDSDTREGKDGPDERDHHPSFEE